MRTEVLQLNNSRANYVWTTLLVKPIRITIVIAPRICDWIVCIGLHNVYWYRHFRTARPNLTLKVDIVMVCNSESWILVELLTSKRIWGLPVSSLWQLKANEDVRLSYSTAAHTSVAHWNLSGTAWKANILFSGQNRPSQSLFQAGRTSSVRSPRSFQAERTSSVKSPRSFQRADILRNKPQMHTMIRNKPQKLSGRADVFSKKVAETRFAR